MDELTKIFDINKESLTAYDGGWVDDVNDRW